MLHLIQHGLVELEGSLELVRLLVGLDHRCVDDRVHRNSIALHLSEHILCASDFIILDTCLKQAAIGHGTGNELSALHLNEHVKGVLELVLLPISLDKNAVGDSTWSNEGWAAVKVEGTTALPAAIRLVLTPCTWHSMVPLSVHLIEKIESTRQVSEANAHIDYAVVEYLIWILSKFAWVVQHLL